MKRSNLVPTIVAQFITTNNKIDECFLFQSETNRGYAIDGIAAVICRRFNGKDNLEVIVNNLEKDLKLTKGQYDGEIEVLLDELEQFKLIEFK